MGKYILAFDIGTSSIKASLFGSDGNVYKIYSYEYKTFFDENGGAEQAPDEWWNGVIKICQQISKEIGGDRIAVMSFSGQESGLVLVDENGKIIRNSMIHCDMRAQKEASDLLTYMSEDEFFHITGHVASAGYTVTKLMWVKTNEPTHYHNICKVLNAKDYIVYKLTGIFVTDHTDASFTGMYDINTKKWSEKICTVIGIDMEKLPEIKESTFIAGKTDEHFYKLTQLESGIPVVLGAGDGQCASIGCGAVKPGKIYNSLGTSSWITVILKNVPERCDKCLETSGHPAGDFANSGGTMQTAGTAREWAIQQLYADSKAEIIFEELSQTHPERNKLIFLPYLNGERVPWWDRNARGTFIGINSNTTRADMLRAVLEGIAFNLRIILDVAKRYEKFDQMIAFGGLTKDKIFCQILADIYEMPVVTLKNASHITALGAAIIGGVAVGIYDDFSIAEKLAQKDQIYYPNEKNKQIYEKKYAIFKKSYGSLKAIFQEMNE